MYANSPQQRIGDLCHEAQDSTEALLAVLGKLLNEAATFSAENGIDAKESHRSLTKVSKAISAAVETNENVLLAHFSMQRIAEKADRPFNCPNEAQAKPDLKVAA